MRLHEEPMPVGKKHKQDEENVGILKQAAAASSALAHRQAKEYGLVVTVVEGGYLVKINPDGVRTQLKALPTPSLQFSKGERHKYR